MNGPSSGGTLPSRRQAKPGHNPPVQEELPRVALVTHSTKPCSGVVHTLSLAEGLQRLGYPAHVIALGDPDRGSFGR